MGRVVLIAAVADNGVIGRNGGLPWHLPADLRRFKALTTGHALVMGRRTFESIGRALPGRSTIVVSRSTDWDPGPDVAVVHDLDDAVARGRGLGTDVYVAGGAEVYRQALPVADRLAITEVHDEPDGDTRFPPVDWSRWVEVFRSDHDGYSFVDYERA